MQLFLDPFLFRKGDSCLGVRTHVPCRLSRLFRQFRNKEWNKCQSLTSLKIQPQFYRLIFCVPPMDSLDTLARIAPEGRVVRISESPVTGVNFMHFRTSTGCQFFPSHNANMDTIRYDVTAHSICPGGDMCPTTGTGQVAGVTVSPLPCSNRAPRVPMSEWKKTSVSCHHPSYLNAGSCQQIMAKNHCTNYTPSMRHYIADTS